MNLIRTLTAAGAALLIASAACAAPNPNDPPAKQKVSLKMLVSNISGVASGLKSGLKLTPLENIDDQKKTVEYLNLANQIILPPGTPLVMNEMEITDGTPSEVQSTIWAFQSVQFINEDLVKLLTMIDEMKYWMTARKLEDIMSYLDSQCSEFESRMAEVDKGVEECIKYTSSHNDYKTFPVADKFLAAVGLSNVWHTVYYNNVADVTRHLRGYAAPDVMDFPENTKKYQTLLKVYRQRVDKLAEETASTPESAQKHLTKIRAAYVSYLDFLDKEMVRMKELYDARKDNGTVHGKLFNGTINQPFGHIKPGKNSNSGGAVYINPYLNALNECKKAYDEKWNEFKRTGSDKDDVIGHWEQLK
ncbi:MAG: hypothetical protein IJ523_00725 [Succinivibrionaceae bacterium]|nr:hypothetical protein [Succinivibrionaceae bacterium]